MLRMRLCAAIVALPFLTAAATADAQSRQQERVTRQQNKAATEQLGSESRPLVIKTLPSSEAETRAKDDRVDREAKRKSDDDLVKFTAQLAEYTKNSATYTGILIWVGIVQGAIFLLQLGAFAYQGKQLKRTVDAAIGADLPILEPTRVQWVEYDMHAAPSQFIPSDYPPPSQPFAVEIEFKNSGRTPAHISGYYLGFHVAETAALPPQPSYGQPIPLDEILRGGETKFIITKPSERAVGGEGLHALEVDPAVLNHFTNPINLWLYGFVSYRDFVGDRHRVGFCYLYAKGGEYLRRGLVLDGGPNYNYRRREPSRLKLRLQAIVSQLLRRQRPSA